MKDYELYYWPMSVGLVVASAFVLVWLWAHSFINRAMGRMLAASLLVALAACPSFASWSSDQKGTFYVIMPAILALVGGFHSGFSLSLSRLIDVASLLFGWAIIFGFASRSLCWQKKLKMGAHRS